MSDNASLTDSDDDSSGSSAKKRKKSIDTIQERDSESDQKDGSPYSKGKSATKNALKTPKSNTKAKLTQSTRMSKLFNQPDAEEVRNTAKKGETIQSKKSLDDDNATKLLNMNHL